jgi:hypothetical protein
MMNLSDIAQRIKNPHSTQIEEIESYQLLIDKYPYAQTFPLLLLKTLGREKQIGFDEALKSYAFQISDREHLYQLIHENESENESRERSDVDLENESENENASLSLSASEEGDQNENEEESEELSQNEHASLSASASEEGDQNENDVESEDEEEILSQKLDDNTRNEFTSQALSQVYSLASDEINEESKEVESELKKVEEEIEIEKETELVSEKIEEEKTDSGDGKSFMSWLMASHSIDFTESAEDQEQKDNAQELLDRFIENEPKIERPKKGLENEIKPKTPFFNPVEKGKESLGEDRMPVSETLAKIFAVQGNFPKAIQAYEQLCLIYPEKKSFFADEIQELKKNINHSS